MMWFGYGNGISGWGYVLMSVSMVIFWALVIAAIVFVVRAFGQAGRGVERPPVDADRTPEQLLAEWFARGDIDADEYAGRLATLHSHAVR